MARADVPSLRKGLGYYEQAVALDPEFSEAWGRIATCRALLFSNSVPTRAPRRSPPASAKSIELAPDKPEGQIALGGTTARWNVTCRVLSRSTERPRPALELPCPAPVGRADMQMGRWQDSITHYDEAERLDPKNSINVGNSSQPLFTPGVVARRARPWIETSRSFRTTSTGSR